MAPALSYQTDGTLDEAVDEKKLESSHASVTAGTFVEGSEGVTHEELSTLRHLPDAFPFAAFLVVVVEFAERWTYYGEFLYRTLRHQKVIQIVPCRLQRRSPCGEITFVPDFHLARPLVPSLPHTKLMVSPVLLGVV